MKSEPSFAEGGRGNWVFPRIGRNRKPRVSEERSEASRRRALERSERERSDEWWFWLKEKQNEPSIWAQAKKLF